MKARVLIVDDEEAVRSSLKMIFEYEGYEVLLAANGSVGLKIAEQDAKIASGKKSVALAERLYESAEVQYRAGYISSVELKDAQLGLNGAQLALAQAVFGYNQNVLDLLDAAGLDGEENQ